MAHQLCMQFHSVLFQPYCSGALEYDSNFFFDPSRLCSLLPDDRALHTGDSRPREVSSGNLPPHVAGATDTALAGPPYPIASRPVASDRASPGVLQQHRPPDPPMLGSRRRRALQEEHRLAELAAAARHDGAPRQQGCDEPMPYHAALFALDASIFDGWAAVREVVRPGLSLREYVLVYPGEADWHLRSDDRRYDTEVGFSYLIARWLSPRCLTRLGLCCVDWYDMVSDNYFRTLLASLFERITRPDWCAAGLCCHGECREAARAGPSDDGGEWDAWPREPEERDGWLCEPDDSAMMEAYFDAKCRGEDGDWADIAFEVSLYEF